ncbi:MULTISPECIES: porin [Cupriavidus]|uniref:porin n=1 Tax=Cupriavidus sp. DF5525 TaxID=3160989 RepID=UPI0003B0FC31|nr:membrane protein [Ralstonia pickettii DTP0602]
MKSTYGIKCRSAALTLGAWLACGAAQAQSGVLLYGGVDANLEYVNHFSTVTPSAENGFSTGPGTSVYRLNSGGLSGSRFGMRGTEELGGGLNAIFVLEGGFALDNGMMQQGGRLFGRQAFVGFDDKGIGTFTFGRQYISWFDALANFSPTAFSTQYEPIVAQIGMDFRSDNTLKYTGVFGPLTASANWSFGNGFLGNGEVPGQFRRDTGYGAALTYDSGPFSATVGYNQYNPTLTTAGDTGRFKKAAVAASYSFDGRAKLMAGYRWGQSRGADGSTVLRDDFYWAGANYNLTQGIELTLGYYYDDIKKFGDRSMKNPWQISFIADYRLSKRTDVYLTTAYSKNAGLNFDTSAVSFINGYFLGTGQSSMFGAAVGIRHNF